MYGEATNFPTPPYYMSNPSSPPWRGELTNISGPGELILQPTPKAQHRYPTHSFVSAVVSSCCCCMNHSPRSRGVIVCILSLYPWQSKTLECAVTPTSEKCEGPKSDKTLKLPRARRFSGLTESLTEAAPQGVEP